MAKRSCHHYVHIHLITDQGHGVGSRSQDPSDLSGRADEHRDGEAVRAEGNVTHANSTLILERDISPGDKNETIAYSSLGKGCAIVEVDVKVRMIYSAAILYFKGKVDVCDRI